MKFDKYGILHLEATEQAEGIWLKSSIVEKDLRDLVDKMLSMGLQHGFAAKTVILNCLRKNIASQWNSSPFQLYLEPVPTHGLPVKEITGAL